MTQTPTFYPGNRDLPVEVRERILSTFRQSVQLLKDGHTEEAASGCDLILKMDPAFVPARKLLEKARNPAAPVDVDALLLSFTGGGPPKASALVAEARAALEAREFPRAIELANQLLRSDLTNQEAQDIGREAQERMEAAPFVSQFLQKARNHAAGGNIAAARADIDKARSLDPAHPEIRQLENALTGSHAPTPPPPAAPEPAFDPGSATPFSFDFQPESSKPAPESSFIVDSPAPGRSSQASDFGFSFEEEQGGSGFVLDSPAAAPAYGASTAPVVGEAQTFDFSTASVETSPEDQDRIAQFLRDGDEAYAAGDYKRATEIWSRIFLLDVTNHEASDRIERARKQQNEIDSQVDEVERAAIAAFEARDFDSARLKFEEIQRVDPGNTTAADYLTRLDGVPAADALRYDEPPPVRNEQDLAAAYGIPLETDLADYEASLRAPGVTPDDAVPTRTVAVPPAARPTRRKGGVLLLAGALILLLAAGYFGYTTFFKGGEQGGDAQQSEVTLNRAQALAGAGKYDQAMTLLASIKPGDPMHDRALALMAEYRNRKSSGPDTIDGRPAEEVFNELVARGQAAFAAQDYLSAKEALERASGIRPLPPDVTAVYNNARQQVAKLESALVLFKEGNYSGAIGVLDALKVDDPNNQSIQRLLTDAHFNLGVLALREERLDVASAEFESVLAANPNDDLARRSRDIASRYQDQPRDLLFQIYVKYLPLR
jgi:tetratricopeptide (TPR) repeat protein